MKQRTSLYFEEEELEMIERAKERLSNKIGMPISRNNYIRHLIFGILNNDSDKRSFVGSIPNNNA
jgi:hypothetical protein